MNDEVEPESPTDTPSTKEHALVLPSKASLKLEPNKKTRNQDVTKDLATDWFDPSMDFSHLKLKPDHASCPLWVVSDGRIILEAFSPIAAKAIDFLITIAEPDSRPERMHQYKLTPYSLYAAVAVGLETKTIINVLRRYSKVEVPTEVIRFIEDCTTSYGKVKLVLKHNRYYIESSYADILRKLLVDEEIGKAFVRQSDDDRMLIDYDSKISRPVNGNGSAQPMQDVLDDFGAVITIDQDDDRDDLDAAALLETESDFVHSFEIKSQFAEDVRKRCGVLDFPLMEEYDFRHDEVNPNLDIDLQPKTIIRDYQEKCLSKMFGNGRARSGIIVLPTGAGKTLVGVTAACTIKKSTLVLCTSGISVEQWANEFRNWSTVKEGQIAKFTSSQKAKFVGDAGIVISTYTMITHSGNRAADTEKMINFISNTEWGLLILDEVHVVPANMFRKVLTRIGAHTKLGLTATLVREDDKITDLNFLIGPKLYEANWMDLADRGHIAKVEVSEVWCPMTAEFYKDYISGPNMTPAKKRLLCVMNPNKYTACEYLINWREAEGDKIIVFSDNVFALKYFAETMKRPYLYGQTSMEERQKVLNLFREGKDPRFRTIFLSKVGDTSLDLPEATCLIQISSQGGSRRQEAQRLGRILRAKRRYEEGFKSRFYTLVSRDTDEMHFSAKRKRFLIDQGYQYKVVPSLDTLIPNFKNVVMPVQERMALLEKVRTADDSAGKEEVIADDDDVNRGRKKEPTASSNVAAGAGRGRGRGRGGVTKEPPKKSNALFKAWRQGK
ncbi:hypothetical protein HK098_006606 [Nowakowskiella sp. JEL0407]|nr:hypothetical protein HK098_006606 [Nowakowskiella sp. JEL0407]